MPQKRQSGARNARSGRPRGSTHRHGANVAGAAHRGRLRAPTMGGAFRIGIDLGGTKIEAAAIDRRARIRARRRIATPAGDYDGTIAALAGLVAAIESEIGAERLGRRRHARHHCRGDRAGQERQLDLAQPPAARPRCRGRARPPGALCQRRQLLCACRKRSTARRPAAAPCSGSILGTGVGGGIVIDGRLLVGANAIAGEWGHNPLPAPRPDEMPGPACYCGRSGCIETFLSGPGLAADHRRHTGRDLAGPQIAAGAAAGDPHCRASARSLRRPARPRSRRRHQPASIPTRSCWAAGSRPAPCSMTRCRAAGAATFCRTGSSPAYCRPRHGDSSGVRGAAWLWPPEERQ